MTDANTIGMVGAGTMGSGIAQVCATAGLVVLLLDLDEARVARGRRSVADGIERMHRKAKLSAAELKAALERLRGSTNDADLDACNFIIEAATEDEAPKRKILRQIEAVARHDATIPTNTSSIQPALILKELVAAGHLGRKPGPGFYTYKPAIVTGSRA